MKKYPLIIKKNYLEDPEITISAGDILKKRRGYIFKIKKGEPVVFIFSGGLDSSVALDMVLRKLKCRIFPLYLERGAKAEEYEKKSVEFFVKFYKKRYPGLMNNIKYCKINIPPVEIKKFIPKSRLKTIGHPMRNSMLQSVGVQYAVALNYQKNINIKTIFTATSPNDTFPHSSLGALRTATIMACIDNGDWNWQITSPLLEPMLWGKITKADLVIYSKKNNLPIKNTRTCTSSKKISCGICPECQARLEAFQEANFSDPIKYER